MTIKLPFTIRVADKSQLPSLERSGHVAQEIHSDLVIIELTQTESIVTTVTGLPVSGLSDELHQCIPIKDVKGTVLVGTLRGKDCAVLLDIVMIADKSVRTLPWVKRDESLRFIHDGFDDLAKVVFPMSHTWDRGLVRCYLDVIDGGGKGLLLRVPDKSSIILVC